MTISFSSPGSTVGRVLVALLVGVSLVACGGDDGGGGGGGGGTYGADCTSGSECSTGICVNDRCSQACNGGGCPNGDACEDFVGDMLCVPGGGGGGGGCGDFDDCLNCTAQNGCGFCGDSGTCQAGGEGGPTDGSCGDWSWQIAECTSGGQFLAPCSCNSHPMMNQACITNDTISVCGSFKCFEQAQLDQPSGDGYCTNTCTEVEEGSACSGGSGTCVRVANPNLPGNDWYVCQ